MILAVGLPEGKERDQCNSKDDSHKKHAARSSSADSGDALANGLPSEYSDEHFFHNVKDYK
jgi:hypothetical protein